MVSPQMGDIFVHRLKALQDILREKKIDGYLVACATDLFYLTGFPITEGYALITPFQSWLFVSVLSFEEVRVRVAEFEVLRAKSYSMLERLIKKNRLRHVCFEPERVNYKQGDVLLKMGFKACEGLVSKLRIIKDVDELSFLRKACRLVAESVRFITPRVRVGRRESSVAAEIRSFFLRHGSEKTSFDIIVASGKNSAYPHHVTSDDRIVNNAPVILDLGCVVGGYGSDLTRTVFLGKINPLYRRVYPVVRKAQRTAIGMVRSGMQCRAVDLAARRVISRAGYGRYFSHGTGHGVGIDVHELPTIRRSNRHRLQPGMVITIEPGVYIPNRLGVRIEDTLLVTDKGHEVLTKDR